MNDFLASSSCLLHQSFALIQNQGTGRTRIEGCFFSLVSFKRGIDLLFPVLFTSPSSLIFYSFKIFLLKLSSPSFVQHQSSSRRQLLLFLCRERKRGGKRERGSYCIRKGKTRNGSCCITKTGKGSNSS